jgi:simple sugar transport system permease protein
MAFEEALVLTAIITILSSGIRFASPILFASLGELITERAGILNLGLEGIMLASAFTSFAGTYFTGSLAFGLLLGILTGMAFGFFMGAMSISIKVNQVIAGIAIWILGVGISSFAYRILWGKETTVPQIKGFSDLNIPFLNSIPILGDLFFKYNLLVYIAFLLVPIINFILYKTTLGLKIRSVGENPRAADSLGINVVFYRYLAIIVGCALVGVGGAYIPLAYVKIFAENIVKGRGWIAWSIVVFGNWRTYRVMLGALLFGIIEALQLYLQATSSGIPYEFLLMLPYVLTIIALVMTARRGLMPLSLNKPYKRE